MVQCLFTGVYRLYGFYGPMVVRNTDHVLTEPLREPKCSMKGESVVGDSVVPRNDLVLRSSTTLGTPCGCDRGILPLPRGFLSTKGWQFRGDRKQPQF